MEDLTRWIVRSTAGLLNLRLASGVRTTGNPESAAQLLALRSTADAARDVLRTNSRRFIKAGGG
jgi:hypothetical protein